MQEVSFDLVVDQIRAKDLRFAKDAYIFVREALDHTQDSRDKAAKAGRVAGEDKKKHVTGQELLKGIQTYALEQFGPMVPTVFDDWGIHTCADFGEIVFNMVEIGLLAKTEKDSRDDFKNGYSFDDAFRKPFLPEGKVQTSATTSRAAE